MLSVEYDISRVSARTGEISCSTREINKVFPSIHVFLCLLYKGKSFYKQILTRFHKLSGWLQSDNFHM